MAWKVILLDEPGGLGFEFRLEGLPGRQGVCSPSKERAESDSAGILKLAEGVDLGTTLITLRPMSGCCPPGQS